MLGGALAGGYSHIALDSIMHADIRPLAPLSQANALYGWLSIDALQLLCAACGALAVLVLVLRPFLCASKAGSR